MRGFLLSIALHIGVIALFIPIVASAMRTDPVPMVILPVELLTIDESTNVAPVSEKAKIEDEPSEVPQEEIAAPKAEPPPPPKEEFVPEAAAAPAKKSEPKKAEAKPEATLDSILAQIDKSKNKQQRTASADAAANLRNVDDAGARKGYGDMKRMTITVADFIKVQLVQKRCWNDQDDMADARRLKATIRVRFGRDGRFLGAPQLIEPSREPSNDPVLQVFIGRARTALAKCNNLGFQVPDEYFAVQPAQYIDIDFLP